ncbi:MAG: type II toxin-antitoxin system HicA family toxin [Candidatus Solibacter usitatus]|nr:type II toxin-antitoxin system HicA family toxin [Candidatus Solibacter usitatus]
MRLPRDLSGDELIEILCRDWNFFRVHQTGSHVILETASPRHLRIAIPRHSPLRIGTLNAILRGVARHKGIRKEQVLGREA